VVDVIGRFWSQLGEEKEETANWKKFPVFI
jgi:hypothetical protein